MPTPSHEYAAAIVADYLFCGIPSDRWAAFKEEVLKEFPAYGRDGDNDQHCARVAATIAKAMDDTDIRRAWRQGRINFGASKSKRGSLSRREHAREVHRACDVVEHAARLPLRAQALAEAVAAVRAALPVPRDEAQAESEAPREVPAAAFAHLTQGPAF